MWPFFGSRKLVARLLITFGKQRDLSVGFQHPDAVDQLGHGRLAVLGADLGLFLNLAAQRIAHPFGKVTKQKLHHISAFPSPGLRRGQRGNQNLARQIADQGGHIRRLQPVGNVVEGEDCAPDERSEISVRLVKAG